MKSRRRSAGAAGRESWGKQAAIAGGVVLLIAAPLLVGGGPGWSQLLCSGLALALTAAYAISRRGDLRLGPFAIPALVATGLTLVQLIPLPGLLIRLLSPHAHELRAETATHWLMPLTLDVPATALAAVRALACTGLIVTMSMAARRAGRARVLAMGVALVGAIVVFVHVVQRLVGARQIFGFYRVIELPDSGFFGTFVNVNHAAALLTLSTLAAAGVALESDGWRRRAAMASAVVCTAGIFSTGSRSGVLGLAAGAVCLTGLRLARRLGPVRGTLLGVGLVAALGVGGLSVSDSLRGRLINFATAPVKEQKVRGWRDSLGLVADYPWAGVGRGAYEAPMTAYRRSTEGVRLAYPENIILQTVAEWGVPAALLLLLLTLVAARAVVPRLDRLEAGVQGLACGLAALAVHDLGDFSLEIPGVALPAAIALGVVIARSQERIDPDRSEATRIDALPVAVALGGWAVVLLAGLWALPHTLQPEGARLRALVTAGGPDAAVELSGAIARHPADYYVELLAANEAVGRKDVAAGKHLNRALRLDPRDGKIHQLTARWLASTGHRAQAALEYRLAAELNVFTPYPELAAAVGARQLAEAVPHTDGWLMQTAGELLRLGRAEEAQEVSRRAVEAGGGNETVSRQRVELTLRARWDGADAARDLLAVASEPASYATAAEALGRAGQNEAVDRAIEAGFLNHPGDSTLILTGARLRLERHDLDGAQNILRLAENGTYSLRERMQFDELRAGVAEKRGETATAAALHARARSLGRLADQQIARP